ITLNEDHGMRPKISSLFLVKSSHNDKAKRPAFRTDEIVCHSGIYTVRHLKHRLPHEVTLLRDQRFPRCGKCDAAVIFEFVRAVADEAEANFTTRIFLYELPVLEDDKAAAG
ncbi:MAG TPA: hypothetical protein VHQ22_09345, partial [Terriglobales bacterium]|nr:hypothetical protein [Terriglobales bacterium]